MNVAATGETSSDSSRYCAIVFAETIGKVASTARASRCIAVTSAPAASDECASTVVGATCH